jgi:hypothetical protein
VADAIGTGRSHDPLSEASHDIAGRAHCRDLQLGAADLDPQRRHATDASIRL